MNTSGLETLTVVVNCAGRHHRQRLVEAWWRSGYIDTANHKPDEAAGGHVPRS